MNQRRAMNTFLGGVDRDTAPIDLKPVHARAQKNMRILSRKGESGVVISVGGNSLGFQLTDGFLPLGYAVYGGVTYIISHNSTTGEGEIGTFPSPKTDCNGGFEDVYRPLRNWTGAVDPDPEVTPSPTRLELRTDLFKFECAHQIEVEAQLSYDGSVNLFFTDNTNPLRWINTGFHAITGVCNDILYWESDLVRRISVFSETCQHPQLLDDDSLVITDGGQLQAGNFFLFFRYADQAFNPTSWLSEIGPIQVTEDTLADGVTLGGAEGLSSTGKSMALTLEGIDPTFAYLEVAIAYCHDDTIDVARIVKYYPIPSGATTMIIKINGEEELGDMTLAELLRQKGDVDTCKTIAQQDNILWGANWRKSVTSYDDMLATCQAVIVEPPDTGELYEEVLPYAWTTGQPASGSQPYLNTLNRIGYFRGESYPFAIQFVFTDGRLSEPFPMTGQDAWFGGGSNNKGILRFPSNMNTGYAYLSAYDSGNAISSRTMGVKFDTSAAPFSGWTDWMKNNICGFYILRGDRRPNLVYQGFLTYAFGNMTSQPNYNLFAPGDGWGYAPSPSPITPIVQADYGNDEAIFPEIGYDLSWRFGMRAEATTTVIVTNSYQQGPFRAMAFPPLSTEKAWKRFGFFSDDHFFQRAIEDGLTTVMLTGRMRFRAIDITTLNGGSSYRDPCTMYDTDGYLGVSGYTDPTLPSIGKVQTTNVPDSSSTLYGPGWTSYFAEGNQEHYENGTPMLVFYRHAYTGYPGLFGGEGAESGNREIRQRCYIGMSIVEAGTTDQLNDDILNQMNSYGGTEPEYPIANIYLRDPRPSQGFSLEDEYQPELVTYHRISEKIDVADWDNLVDTIFYRGDCFLNRTYHRHTASGGYHDNEFAIDYYSGGVSSFVESRYYKYGNLVGTIFESAINTAMRVEEGTGFPGAGRYYPKVDRPGPVSFSTDFGAFAEGNAMNNGYNVMLGLLGQLGNDPLVPFHGTEYPTRIRYSHRFEPDNLQNGYLSWDLAAYHDYNTFSGPINRIMADGSVLVSVQHRAISIHPVNREALLRDNASEGELLVGTGDVLPQKANVLTSEYGTQHQWSVIKTDRGIYGYDQEKRVIWRIQGGQLQPLSDMKQFSSDILGVSEYLSDHSDLIHLYPDGPVCSGGVVAFWDRKHGEVGWSWRIYEPGELSAWIYHLDTLVYNEKLDIYQHQRTHHSPFYITLNEDLYSANPAQFGPDAVAGQVGFWLHDDPVAAAANFYGTQWEVLLQYVVNEGGPLVKWFMANHLHVNEVPPSSIHWATSFQTSELDPFSGAEDWMSYLYAENRQKGPIAPATAITGSALQDYEVGSNMRGPWMSAEWRWSSDQPVRVSFAETIFQRSES